MPRVDPDHEKQLTRDEITASVHYVHWQLDADQVERLRAGPVVLAVTHPEYDHDRLGPSARAPSDRGAELPADLARADRPAGSPGGVIIWTSGEVGDDTRLSRPAFAPGAEQSR